MLLKKDLMAKAGVCLGIVFSSLKAGSDFNFNQESEKPKTNVN